MPFCSMDLEIPTLLSPLETANLSHWTTHVKVKVILRTTVSRPACPGVRPPSGSRDQFFFHFHGNYILCQWLELHVELKSNSQDWNV
jgi:hypothetical protein